MDELPKVLWAYRTIACRPIGISLFALNYGIETIVPIEISMPTLRTDLPEQSNAETVIKDLDMADALCEVAVVRIASYHNKLENLYNRRVKLCMFQSGDLVLRKVFENTADPSAKKFKPNWEETFIVTRSGESGSYALDKLNGTHIPRMWNVIHLKRYYQ